MNKSIRIALVLSILSFSSQCFTSERPSAEQEKPSNTEQLRGRLLKEKEERKAQRDKRREERRKDRDKRRETKRAARQTADKS